MRKHLFWMASLAFVFAACSDKDITIEEPTQPDEVVTDQTTPSSNLTTVKLASFNGSQDRVVIEPETRAEEKTNPLTLLARIDNLSLDPQYNPSFVKEDRLLSASCVYYDQSTGKYYVTYHMQGNNYKTDQEVETSGYIETFTLDNNNLPVVGKVYTASDPSKLAFDFNHLLFDDLKPTNTEQDEGASTYDIDDDSGIRIITVGHTSEPVKTGNGFNTKAMIAQLDLESSTPQIKYAPIMTGDKIYKEGVINSDGSMASLGDEDAGDANCVIRKFNNYCVATREGLALLKASKKELFAPVLDETGHNYFIKTPGSCKYLDHTRTSSWFRALYLNEDTPENFDGKTEIPARIINLSYNLGIWQEWNTPSNPITNVANFDFNSWRGLSEPINAVCPVDGKNVLSTHSYYTDATFACLGKGGLFITDGSYGWTNHIEKFSDAETGSRPVNGVFVEDYEDYNGHHYTDGFIYVANGACLTILERKTLEKVAEYSLHSKENKIDASCNFVHVVKTNEYTNEHVPDRIITVACGQAGVRVFKFVPPTKYND